MPQGTSPQTFSVLFRSEVVLKNEADALTRAQQRELIRRLEVSPENGKPLAGRLRGCYRHRIEALRVVYSIDLASRTVMVIAIGPRRDSEIYRVADGRVQR